MSGNLLSIAAAALRSPYSPNTSTGSNRLSLGGVRLLNPVVRGEPQAQATPAPVRSPETDRTRYTPGTARTPTNDLYNRAGGLNTTGYQAVSQSVSYASSDTFDLSIETADGDIATISISQQQSQSASFGAASAQGSAGPGSVLALSTSSADSLDFKISIQGDLSAEETASINALVGKVNGVAEDFFAGDIKQATQAASRSAFDPEDDSLSGYSFSLKSQESLRAVAMYESVAAAAPDISVAPAPRPLAAAEAENPTPQPKADFLQSLRAMLDDLTRSAKALTA